MMKTAVAVFYSLAETRFRLQKTLQRLPLKTQAMNHVEDGFPQQHSNYILIHNTIYRTMPVDPVVPPMPVFVAPFLIVLDTRP